MKRILTILLSLLFLLGTALQADAQERVLIPMDASQNDHLKAYGIIFNHLLENQTGQWLLNYRGGSFLTANTADIVRKSRVRGVSIELISEAEAERIIRKWSNPM